MTKTSPDKILRNQHKFDFMTHVSVPLTRLEGLDEIEPWCMTHCLYKCFCNGNNMIGKPFAFSNRPGPAPVIQKPVYVQQNFEEMVIPQSRKRKYTFLKDGEAEVDENLVYNPKTKSQKSIELSEAVNFEDLIDEIETETARCVPINSKKWLFQNRKRRKEVIESMRMNKKEQHYANAILKDRITKCFELVQYENKQKAESDLRKDESSHIYIPVDIHPDSSRNSFSNSNESQLPIITDAVSLNSNQNDESFDDNSVESSKMKSKNIAKLNYYVSRAMTSICEIQKRSTKNIIVPKSKTINLVKWSCLVDAFNEDLVFIWEIRRNRELILAMTVTNTIPILENATSIVNIKAVSPRCLPLLAKMLFVKLNNERTKTLGVLLYGFENYWALVGFTHSNYNYMELGRVVKLSPNQNPGLSAKIALLYKRMVETKLISHPGYIQNYEKEQRKAYELLLSKKKEEEAAEVEKQRLEEERKQLKKFPNMPTQVGALDLPFDVSTNILIDDANVTDPKSVFVPIPIVGDHRWLMLTIVPDFTNIYIHPWKSFLKYDKIVNALRVAKISNKTVKITSNVTDANPYVYATPTKDDKIFIGPYKNNETARIVLWQLLKGKFLLREDYERTMNIKRDQCTKGSWLYMKGDRIMGKSMDNESMTSEQQSDDDCMIVDEEKEMVDEPEEIVDEEFITNDEPEDFEPKSFVIDRNDHSYQETKKAQPHPVAIHKVKRNFVIMNNQIVPVEIEPAIQAKPISPPNLATPSGSIISLKTLLENPSRPIQPETLKRAVPFDLTAFNGKKIKLQLPANGGPPPLTFLKPQKYIEVPKPVEKIPIIEPSTDEIIELDPEIESPEKTISDTVSKISKSVVVRKITSDSLVTKMKQVTDKNPQKLTSIQKVQEYLDQLKDNQDKKLKTIAPKPTPPPIPVIITKVFDLKSINQKSQFSEFTDNSIDKEREPIKDDVIVLSEDEDCQNSEKEIKENVAGFLISNILSLGKIPCNRNKQLEYQITLSNKRFAGSFQFIAKHLDL